MCYEYPMGVKGGARPTFITRPGKRVVISPGSFTLKMIFNKKYPKVFDMYPIYPFKLYNNMHIII